MIKKINNKILNTLVANIIVRHCHKDEIDYVKRFGFTVKELKEWLNLIFVNKLYSLYKDHPLIEWILCSLCEAEMELKLVADKEFRDDLLCADIGGGYENKSNAMINIPENTFYCSGCPYGTNSKLATLLFGYQMNGYCYYLRRGDFSFNRPTDELWDGCKECGINDDINDEDDE